MNEKSVIWYRFLGLSVLVTIAMFAAFIFFWPQLPSRIPMRYDTAGNPYQPGNKSFLFMLPVICLLVSLFISVLVRLITRGRMPFNWFVPVTDKNRERAVRETASLMSLICLEVVVFLAYTESALLFTALKGATIFSPWSVLAFVLVLFGTVGRYWTAALEGESSQRGAKNGR